jgi:hypothetical protein
MPRYALTESTQHLNGNNCTVYPFEKVQVQKYNITKNKIGYYIQVLKWNEEREIYEALYTIDSKEFNFEDNSDETRAVETL